MSRLWDKGAPLDERVLAFTAGDDYALDERLVKYDVRASLAHVEMLNAAQLLSDSDLSAIRAGLSALADEHAQGQWKIELSDEDGQTALERRLTARIGPAGGRVHLGRSRNDQVLAALRLYLLDAGAELAAAAEQCAAALDALARREGNVALPGYTHMQQAMPSSVALWAGGFAAELRDDAEGLRGTARRASKNPLGSAAGYGTPGLPLDRELTCAKLGFEAVHAPVTAVQLSRGKAEAQLLFECALLMQDLGRLASDLLLFYTQEFAFVDAAGLRSPPARRSCRRSATPMCSSWCAAAPRWPTPASRKCWHLREAAVGISARPAAHQAAAVSRHRPRPGHGRHHGAGHRWRAFPRGPDQTRSRDSCRRGSQCAGRARGHPVPRSVSPHRRKIPQVARALPAGDASGVQ